MSLHSSMTPQAIFRRMTRDQSAGAPLPIKRRLEIALWAAESAAAQGVEASAKRAAELREQLRLLKGATTKGRKAFEHFRKSDEQAVMDVLLTLRRAWFVQMIRDELDASDLGESPWDTRRDVGV